MIFLRRLLAPRNALILAYDHFTQESTEEMEAQVDELRKYYRFVPLSELVRRLKSRSGPRGEASIAILNARKSAMLRALPRLADRSIPFTVFLRTDCIGFNRLPAVDEAKLFQEQYPKELKDFDLAAFEKIAWVDPDGARKKLDQFRSAVGPFPIETIDPTLYFGTWGKVLEIPKELREFGVHLPAGENFTPLWKESLRFIRQQTKIAVTLAYSPQPIAGGEVALQRLGIGAVLTADSGIVDKKTSPFGLPQYGMEKNSHEEEQS